MRGSLYFIVLNFSVKSAERDIEIFCGLAFIAVVARESLYYGFFLGLPERCGGRRTYTKEIRVRIFYKRCHRRYLTEIAGMAAVGMFCVDGLTQLLDLGLERQYSCHSMVRSDS